MPKPTIDDDFWFALSKEMVDGTGKGVVEAAGKVQTFSVWAWGIYTAAAAAGFTLAAKGLTIWQSAWISAPSVALVLVYWLSVWTQLPVRVEFDPRSPDLIRKAYSNGARERGMRLMITSIVSLIAASLVGVGLTVAALAKESKAPDLQAEAQKVSSQTFVAILARTAPSTRGTFRVRPKITAGAPAPVEGTFMTDSSGRVQMSVPVGSMSGPLEASLNWIGEGGLVHELRRTVGEVSPASCS